MNYWAAIILSGLLLDLACGHSPVDKITVTETLKTENSAVPAPPVQQKLKISDDIVYTHILESIVYGSDSKDAFEVIKGIDHFTVRKETVAPTKSDGIESSSTLPSDLINDFAEKNQSKTQLSNGYAAKISHDVVEQKGTLDTFFRLIKRKQPRLKAVIGLSQVGFNADHTKSLVYVE